jgi:hypothetical protein
MFNQISLHLIGYNIYNIFIKYNKVKLIFLELLK